jgi:regulator of protease activity HflC (stomatin/prohibitin superfamily)
LIDQDRYRSVVGVLLAFAGAGALAAIAGGFWLSNPALLDVAVTLALATGLLVGVALAQAARLRSKSSGEAMDPVAAEAEAAQSEDDSNPAPTPSPRTPRVRWRAVSALARRWLDGHERAHVGSAVAAGAVGVTVFIRLMRLVPAVDLTTFEAGIAAMFLLAGAGLATTAVRYLVEIPAGAFPEGPSLARGGRLVGWILVAGAASVGLQWWRQTAWLQPLDILIVLINMSACYGLLTVSPRSREESDTFQLDLSVLNVLGGRTNILASAVDAAEAQLGIDLRSSWALTVVRRSAEPLAIGLCLLAWLATSLTVVGIGEQGLVERLGVPAAGPPLSPGLHVHLPWPVDRVFRLPVQRVQALTVGHEGEENGGPEDVLWAREHAANEYTLLLGNGRDLITVDAAVQFHIRDARAWHYRSQNPADALRAIAYRAVMRNTVNRTLADALSENLVTTTARMREMVQQDADALDLGIEVLGFTVGGMHPPVAVAEDYQSVVSAQLGKVTAVVNAQAVRNLTVPVAEASSLTAANAARADAAEAIAAAAGEAWGFLALQSEYRAAPAEYMFRRRLETLEKGLRDRLFTILDVRFQRDGGELWLTP